jgi:hypothetical protein
MIREVSAGGQDGVRGAESDTGDLDLVGCGWCYTVAAVAAEPSIAHEAGAPIMSEAIQLGVTDNRYAGGRAEISGS